MNIALVLAGGTGTRMGADVPKQYIEVEGRMLISFCLEVLLKHKDIHGIQIVADEAWHGDIRLALARLEDCNGHGTGHSVRKLWGFSAPGINRQMSILNGLRDIRVRLDTDGKSERNAAVLIHDAARPLLSERLISDCIEALPGHDGVMPVLPMKDTVYMSKDGESVSELLPRDRIFAGQAPELFYLEPYYDACTALMPERILQINGSTEAAVFGGLDVTMVQGDENNFKVTTAADLERFLNILEKRRKNV